MDYTIDGISPELYIELNRYCSTLHVQFMHLFPQFMICTCKYEDESTYLFSLNRSTGVVARERCSDSLGRVWHWYCGIMDYTTIILSIIDVSPQSSLTVFCNTVMDCTTAPKDLCDLIYSFLPRVFNVRGVSSRYKREEPPYTCGPISEKWSNDPVWSRELILGDNRIRLSIVKVMDAIHKKM